MMKSGAAIRKLALLLAAAAAFSCCWGLNRFSNFGPVNSVSDILVDSSVVYVATSGGLYALDTNSGTGRMHQSSGDFPDIKLTALCRDSTGKLWIGSDRGYLSQWKGGGATRIIASYAAAGWDIADLSLYGRYVLVASSKGLSVFDAAQGRAIGNATKFGSFAKSGVLAVVAYRGVLYVGCSEGIASVDVSGSRITQLNFYDRSIWSTRATAEPVVAFIEHNGSLQGVSHPSVFFNKAMLFGDSSSVFYDNRPVMNLPGAVTCVAASATAAWIGTRDNYFYHWSGSGDPVQHQLNGLAFGIIVRVEATPDGGAWALTQLSTTSADGYTTPWNQGLVRVGGDGRFDTYNERNVPSMGKFGDGAYLHGLFVDRSSTLWLGGTGGNLKRRDPVTGAWSIYWVSGANAYAGFSLVDPSFSSWGKSDAIIEDSAGYTWISSWNNHFGCIIAYDSKYLDPTGHFRRHLPLTSPYYLGNVLCFCIAPSGVICAGSEDGKFLAFSYPSDPTSQDISIIDKFEGLTTVQDMAATSDGIVWVVSGQGLYQYDTQVRTLTKYAKVTDAITCIEAESKDVLWLGTPSNGLIRYSIADSQKTVVSAAQGLLNDAVSDLSLDRGNGLLWVATYQGLSRYSLEHGNTRITNNEQVRVFPNPFSLSNPLHQEVVVQHIAPGSKVRICDARGHIMEELSPSIKSEYEWTYLWKPRRSLVPGTYVCAAIPPSGRSTAGKLLIIP